MKVDCDGDSLLIMAKPEGPTCHTGDYSCFGEKEEMFTQKSATAVHSSTEKNNQEQKPDIPKDIEEQADQQFTVRALEKIISDRAEGKSGGSYTYSLLQKGINKVAQKVGEEAVELVIEAKDDNRELFLNEAADLMYHYLVLLKSKGISLREVEQILEERHKN
jgi:phosphoribosyl-ATP pyrophosphohydrolase/phosphoribosyl-AMP cyclohydrolase